MPRAVNMGQKFHYADRDTELVNVAPPVQNVWYEVFTAEDVRLLWCTVRQRNDELAAKTVEVRWTIDGNVYRGSNSVPHLTAYFAYRDDLPSAGGAAGLQVTSALSTATKYTCKRGKNFKVEVRLTSAPGTNQILRCYCVKEILELT